MKRKFQLEVGRLGPVGTVVEPKALPSRKASPGSMKVSAPELAPWITSGSSWRVTSSTYLSRVRS